MPTEIIIDLLSVLERIATYSHEQRAVIAAVLKQKAHELQPDEAHFYRHAARIVSFTRSK